MTNLSGSVSLFIKFDYHVSICLLIGLCNLKFLKNIYISTEVWEKVCCMLPASLSDISQYFRIICQLFHNPINNDLSVNKNVGASGPNQIYLFPSIRYVCK